MRKLIALALLLAACGEQPAPVDNATVSSAPEHGVPPDHPRDLCAGNGRVEPGTLTVLVTPRPSDAGPPWSGWFEASVISTANSNGVQYQIDLRWTLIDPQAGTCAWLVGGNSGAFYRDSQTLADQVQDQLIANSVRCLDIRFAGGDDTFPRNSFVNMAAPLADALLWADSQGIITRPFVVYGNSGGANLMTAFVLHHGGHRLVDGLVTGGGPWWMDLADFCGAPVVDEWAFEDVGGCRQASEEMIVCRSMLGPTSVRALSGIDIRVLIGLTDPNGALFVQEGQRFLNAVVGKSELLIRPNAPHQILANQEGADAVRSVLRPFFQ